VPRFSTDVDITVALTPDDLVSGFEAMATKYNRN